MGDYWQSTIDILQSADPIISKPKLSEKLLTKPPFKFLHDVVSAVQQKTGFAPGLFQGDELDKEKLQDKDSKVLYLTKIINVVAMALGESVPAKPLKIVAGLEPENTNAFLQLLGKACTQGDASDCVQRVLGGEEPGAAAKPAKKEAKAPPKAAAPPPAAAEEKPKKKSSTEAKVEEAEKPKKKVSSSGDGGKSKTSTKEKEAPAPMREVSSPQGPQDGDSSFSAAPQAMPERPGSSMGRPQSARKAPPKVTTNTTSGPAVLASPANAQRAPASPSIVASNDARGGEVRPGSAALVPPGSRGASRGAPSVMLIEEGSKGRGLDDDDDVEVVHEKRPVAIGADRSLGEAQGVLVKDILESEKNLKKAEEHEEEGSGGKGIILGRLGARAGASAVAAGIKSGDHAAIREMVQKLCQSSHPLAKSMDYMQEDLENMSKEYRFWVSERKMFHDRLGDEQRMAEDQAAADAKLADLENQIKQVRDRTIGLKAQVVRNDETIAKLLNMAVTGGR